ncbi:MAG: hypothetical protein GY696_14070 [Gammaproteobacteria bacterium]|nr:hypothetical protein [Gammaproteobacteria bacterium]
MVFLGREAKLPADMILPNQQEEFQHRGDAVAHCLKNMDKIYDYLKQGRNQDQPKQYEIF